MKEIDEKDIDVTRRLLEKHNETSSIVVHESTKRYGYILENNVKDAKDLTRRMVVWRGMYGDFDIYCMERNEFYSKFKEAFNDDNAIIALTKYFYKERYNPIEMYSDITKNNTK
jgi:hypothetical protein